MIVNLFVINMELMEVNITQTVYGISMVNMEVSTILRVLGINTQQKVQKFMIKTEIITEGLL